jgi:transcription antitermination factor NusA-like protein
VRDVDTYRFKMDVELRAGGAVVLVDRTSSCARLLADSPDMARRAADAVQAKFAQWEETHATLAVHEYMLASLVGKNGTAILGLQKELQVGIQLNRTSVPMQLEIEAPDKTTLDAAMASLAETVKKLRRGHWSIAVDPELIGLLIGKQGANIIKLRTETGASVEVDRRTGTIEVNGDEDKVAKARAHVEAFVEEHKETACSAQVRVPAAAFPLVIGTKGAMAMEISDTSGAKFDLDRVHEVAMLKGTKEACQKAVEMIQALLERAGFPTSNKPVPAKAGAEEGNEEGSAPVVAHEGNGLLVNGQSGPGGGGGGGTAARAGPRVLPGATPAMVAKMQEQAMSKSAARRKRRKEQLQQEEQQDEDEEEQEEERADDADGGDDDDDDGAGVDGDGDDDVDDEDESAHFAQAEPFARSLPLPHHGLAGGGGGGVRTEHSLENGVAPLHHTTASPVGVIGRSTFSSPGTAAATAATAAATAVGVSPKPFDLPAVSPTARDYLDAQTGSDDHFRAPAYEAPAALAAALHGTTAFNQPPLGLGGFPPPPGLGPAGLIGIAPLPLGYAAAPPRSPAPVSTLGGAPISPVASGILSGLVGGLGGLAPPLTAAGHPAAALQPRTPAAQPPQLQQNSTTEQLLSMILGAAPLPLPATAKSSSTSSSSLPLPATTNQPAASVGATARAPAGAATTHTNGNQPQQRPPPARQTQTTTTNSTNRHFLSKSGFAVRL